MEIRDFGLTGLKTSVLGFGAGHIGSPEMEEREVTRLLNQAVDLGINLIDTARGYNLSEERIGKALSSRRKEIILSTKTGYGISGETDWTYGCVQAGIDNALRLLKTDYIDIVFLHSCPIETLRQGEVIDALDEAKRAGKIRVMGYSGENEALRYAVETGRFGALQASINICDQKIIDDTLPLAKQKGMGVIAKRPLANFAWQYQDRPIGKYAEDYWLRLKKMNLNLSMNIHDPALRFPAYIWGVDSCIIGTANINHLKKNVEMIGKGKLPDKVIEHIRNSFKNNDDNWIGLV